MTLIDIKILDERLKQRNPQYATSGSAAMDLMACIDSPISMPPGNVVMIPTGFAMDIRNSGIAAMLLPRSGMGAKQGLVLGNLVGLIDSDYQGQVMVCMWNRGDEWRQIHPMERIAQVVFVPVVQVKLNVVDEFKVKTQRGEGGFGSTGTQFPFPSSATILNRYIPDGGVDALAMSESLFGQGDYSKDKP